MKVLFVMNGSFSSHSTSEHLLTAVLERLAFDNHQVHVIQMLKPGDDLVLPHTNLGENVTTEAVYVKPQKKNNFVARYLNANKNYLNCRHSFKENADSNAVFLQSTNAAGLAVFLVRRYIKNAKITYNVQDIFPYNAVFSGHLKKSSIAFKLLAAIQRYGYNHSDRIITISEDMKDTLVDDGVESDKIDVIYNWSYQDKPYDGLDLSPVAHMFDDKYFNVVYAGNIGVMQNVDILIEAAKLLKGEKSVWFHIIGNGVYKDKLEVRVKEYGITNISFWPMQPPELAPLIYCAADVNVIPLVKNVYKTALPSKTATCLACQKPIVFAIGKESKFGQIVKNETDSIVTESDNSEEIVTAIKSAMNKRSKNNTAAFFKEKCSITNNSRRYAQIITGE